MELEIDLKDKPIFVRVTPEEKAIIVAAAKRENRSVSNFMRQAAKHYLTWIAPEAPKKAA